MSLTDAGSGRSTSQRSILDWFLHGAAWHDVGCGGGEAVVEGHGRAVPTGEAAEGQGMGGGGGVVTAATRHDQEEDSDGSSSRPVESSGQAAAVAEGGCRQAVLSSDDVLGGIFSFLVDGHTTSRGGGRMAIRELIALSEVCRKWRAVGVWPRWWSDIGSNVLPAFPDRFERSRGDPRSVVLEYGRRVCSPKARMFSAMRWMGDWMIYFEIFDGRDGLQLLSLRGLLYCLPHGYADEMHVKPCFGLSVSLPWFSEATPFSTRSRNRPSMQDYLQQDVQRCMELRVWVQDVNSGKMGMLWQNKWQHGNHQSCRAASVAELFHFNLPAGSLCVEVASESFITCPSSEDSFVPRMTFFVQPQPGQENVAEEDRLWRVAIGHYQRCTSLFLSRMCEVGEKSDDPDGGDSPPIYHVEKEAYRVARLLESAVE